MSDVGHSAESNVHYQLHTMVQGLRDVLHSEGCHKYADKTTRCVGDFSSEVLLAVHKIPQNGQRGREKALGGEKLTSKTQFNAL